MLPSRPENGLTLLEILVILVVVALLYMLSVPQVGYGLRKGGLTQSLSNMKQLHLATQQMALDGLSTDNPKMNWPGDTGGTFEIWAHLLVPEYLSTNDFCKLTSAAGKIVPPGKIPKRTDCSLLVYAVKKQSADSTTFLSSANFTNTSNGGVAPTRSSIPYGDRGFLVFRKGSDGAILLPKQAGQTNLVGTFAPLCH